jgi:hypothetical protein
MARPRREKPKKAAFFLSAKAQRKLVLLGCAGTPKSQKQRIPLR